MEFPRTVSILGEDYEVRRDVCLTIDHSRRLIRMNPGDAGHRKRLLRAMRLILLQEIEPMIEEYAKKLGVEVKRVSIKNMRGRWGSCAGDGNLNFSLWLVCLPRELIRYVVFHEVAHIIEKNHGRDFKRIIETEFENRRELERRLRGQKVPAQLEPGWD
jgi:predicted metal-dependent hydrolase